MNKKVNASFRLYVIFIFESSWFELLAKCKLEKQFNKKNINSLRQILEFRKNIKSMYLKCIRKLLNVSLHV